MTAKSKLIEGLDALSEYTAVIYDGEVKRGTVKFKTKTAPNLITINDVSYSTLAVAIDAASSGDVIKLKTATFDYTGTTITLNGKSLTIEPYDDNATPVIKLKTFDLRGDAPTLKFSGLTLQHAVPEGYTQNDYEKHTFGGTWLTATTNITLENCNISGWLAGLFFAQDKDKSDIPEPATGTAIISLTIDGCLLHDFGASGGDFIDFRSQTIAKVDYKNTSLWKSGRVFFRVDNKVLPQAGHSVTFSNSTFDSFAATRFLQVKATTTDPLTISFTNCIFTNKTGTTANDVQNTTVNFDNNDFFGTNNALFYGSAATNTGSSSLDPQYTDAANGDFTVGNATVKAAAQGDPRWLQ